MATIFFNKYKVGKKKKTQIKVQNPSLKKNEALDQGLVQGIKHCYFLLIDH